MNNTAWGIISLIALILNLVTIPGCIAREEYISAAMCTLLAVLGGMTMAYFFMS